MYMDEPTLMGSDPETSIAVPEQLIRIDLMIREQRIAIDCAMDRVRFNSFAGDLPESGAAHAKQ